MKLVLVAFAALLVLPACDKAQSDAVPMTNELRAPITTPPPVKTVAAPLNARGGVADDGVKVAPLPVNAPKAGPLPLNPRGGVPDDSIKPVPKP